MHLDLEGGTNDDNVFQKEKDKSENKNFTQTLHHFLHFPIWHSFTPTQSIICLLRLTVNSNRSVDSPEGIGGHAIVAPQIPLEQVADGQSHVRLVRLSLLCHPVLLTTNKPVGFALRRGRQFNLFMMISLPLAELLVQ